MQTRVSESISRRTFSPWSRKYSAILVAARAARIRRAAAVLLVAAMTTEPSPALLPEVVFDEVADLAAPLSNQGNDLHVRIRIASHHSQQCTFSNPEPAIIANR